jgi:hypothetical protein
MIVADSLFSFQYILSNNTRLDCVIFLPDQRPIVIDASFPLKRLPLFAKRRAMKIAFAPPSLCATTSASTLPTLLANTSCPARNPGDGVDVCALATDLIRTKVGRLMEDVGQQQDLRQILVSAHKISSRAGRIDQLDFYGGSAAGAVENSKPENRE